MIHELMESIETPIAFVVDDDDVDREVMARVLKNQGIRVRTYAKADSFLQMLSPEQIGCLVLDLSMPGMSGQELQDHLIQRQIKMPIIIVSGLLSVSIATRAIRLGAIDVLEKPVQPDRLFSVVKQSLDLAIALKQSERLKREIHIAMDNLTEKERLVLRYLLDGLTMKQMSEMCECSIATVARYQAKVLEKLGARNTSHLAVKLHGVEATTPAVQETQVQ